jgi:hypothetical protein
MNLLEKFLYWLTDRLPCRFIDSNGAPYLDRFYVCTFPWDKLASRLPLPEKVKAKIRPWRLFIHHFVDSDPDRGLHSHPWKWALSWILIGGYTELKLLTSAHKGLGLTEVERKPGKFNLIKEFEYHRVLVAHKNKGGKGVWTLFLHGPRTDNGWKFLTYRLKLNENASYAELTEVEEIIVATEEERKRNSNWWERNLKGKSARARRAEAAGKN